jgi:hypothetical protein
MLTAVGLVLIDVLIAAAGIGVPVITPIGVGRAVFALIQEPSSG